MTTYATRLVVAVLLLYFTVHAISGDQGLVRWVRLQSQEEHLQQRLSGLQAEKLRLEAHLLRLRTESLDIDYLDYLARSRLALVLPDEMIFFGEELPLDAGEGP